MSTTKTPTQEKTDPLIGTQRETESAVEAAQTPEKEVTMHKAPMGSPQHSRKIAGVLGLLLGGLGAHRFYLGFVKVGALQAAVTLAAFLTVMITGLVVSPDAMLGYILVGIGVAMLGMVWGASEGIAILLGAMPYDANRHPLSD